MLLLAHRRIVDLVGQLSAVPPVVIFCAVLVVAATLAAVSGVHRLARARILPAS